MKKNKLLIEVIKKDIDNAKIISFDIFDTLLLRPYVRPADLFLHIEKIENKPFFCERRQEAERNARIKHPDAEDITFDEIYDEIDDSFKLLKQTELKFEEMVLSQNPELKQVYDYALQQNKKIIITSDMYLPDEFLSAVLKKNGFAKYDRIFVSGNVGKTKHSGNLYLQVIKELKVDNPKDILHIGDNKKSDYEQAEKCGINAVLYQQVIKQFLAANIKAAKFWKQNKDKTDASILLAILALKWQNQRCNNDDKFSYWEYLGYAYAGPLAYGYSRFVEREAAKNGLSKLLFVARDGYTLQKVFNMIAPEADTAYVYAPRLLNLTIRMDYLHKDFKESQAVIDYYSAQDDKIKNAYSQISSHKAKSNHQFIQDNRSLFLPLAQKTLANYKKYLSGIVKDNGVVGIVDTITYKFSSQKLLQSSLTNKTHGIYWGILKNKFQNTFEYSTFSSEATEVSGERDIFTANWTFIEFLITSPEYPIKNITDEGMPVYDAKPTKSEIIRAGLYPEISRSAVLFAEDIKRKFGGADIFLSFQTLVSWINCFVDNPTAEDIDCMAKISIGADSTHSRYIPLFVEKVSFGDFIKQPLKTIRRLRKNIWKTLSQKILLSLFVPFSIKNKGLRQIQIAILPSLFRRYLTLSLVFSEKWFYKFIVGSDKK